jgi:hypothetical protein
VEDSDCAFGLVDMKVIGLSAVLDDMVALILDLFK